MMEQRNTPSEREIYTMPDLIPPTTEQPNQDPTVQELLKKLEQLQLNTVPKEDYDKSTEANKLLIGQLTTNRPVINQAKTEPTREDIISRCKARTEKIGKGNAYEDIKGLVDNYHDMQTLKMETPGVDEKVIEALDLVIKESNGDAGMFKAIMDARFKSSK